MAGRKLVRDFFLTRQPLFVQLAYCQGSIAGKRSVTVGGCSGNRRFSVFNEFSKNVKGEAKSSPEFQQSVKELKEKAEDLKNRTKQTTEQLYKHVDGVWSEAEATAKKVSSNIKEKISAAKEEVKESFNIGKQESSGSPQSSGTSAQHEGDLKSAGRTSSGEEKHKQSDTAGTAESLFGKFKSGLSSPKVSLAFQKLKETKVSDLAKKGYDIVKDEISGNPSKKRHLEYAPPSWAATTSEKSERTDVVIIPKKQSYWGKRWDGLKDKMRDHPLFKRISVFSEPVVTKSQEIAEDVRERWETSDSPIVHKIQDINESLSQETDAAASRKEIHRRDPSFSLPDFVAEVQEAIKPVLTAYKKGDTETLKKYCTSEVVERCKGEHTAYKSHDIFFDNKILHISEVEVREMKMMGTSPIIIVVFQTQQIYCVRDRQGVVKEGGKDTIHTVYYAWAMQQIDPEELGDGAIYPIWKLREMQEMGIQALI